MGGKKGERETKQRQRQGADTDTDTTDLRACEHDANVVPNWTEIHENIKNKSYNP